MTLETFFSAMANLPGLLFVVGSILATYFGEVQEPALIAAESRVLGQRRLRHE
jgi:hypothetical protein